MSGADTRWHRARRIFLHATRLAGPERVRAVRGACGDDPELVDTVLSLLAGHHLENGPLDRLAATFGAPLSRHLRQSSAGAELEAPPHERYRVLRDLGRGGMGVVRLARDTSLNRLVAIKTLDPAIARSGGARRQLLREARLVAALDHPNVVAIHEVGLDEQGALFLVFAYCEGETLKARLARGSRIPVDRAIEIARCVARALQCAHRQRIVHRDIKPSNILLSGDGTVKLTDFGIADRQDPGLASGGPPAGTPGYMSPEQRSGEPVDHRSDLWSLGCVLYEMLTRERSAPRADEPLVLGRPPGASESCRAALERILKRVLEPDPSRRYRCAAEMLTDLERAARSEPGREGSRRKRPAHAPRTAAVLCLAVSLSLIVTSEVPGRRAGAAVAPGEAGHVLWVDDDPGSTVEEAARLVESGFRITRARSTAGALEFYETDVFDLVITDLGRMERSGYNARAGLDLLGRLRELDPGASVVFFTSAPAVESFGETALAAGAKGITSRSAELYEVVRLRR